MPRAQFNPSTLKASFDSATNRAQMVGAPCDKCPPNTTPPQVKINIAGVLVCPSPGNCCPEIEIYGAASGKIIEQGIGWDMEMILNQGRCWYDYSGLWGPPCNVVCPDPHPSPCQWSGVVYGDFGSFEAYNLDNCGGGIQFKGDFYAYIIRILKIGNLPDCSLEIRAHLGWVKTSGSGRDCDAIQIFHAVYAIDPDVCLPYDHYIYNGEGYTGDFDCGSTPQPCIGDGTAILTEWP